MRDNQFVCSKCQNTKTDLNWRRRVNTALFMDVVDEFEFQDGRGKLYNKGSKEVIRYILDTLMDNGKGEQILKHLLVDPTKINTEDKTEIALNDLVFYTKEDQDKAEDIIKTALEEIKSIAAKSKEKNNKNQ